MQSKKITDNYSNGLLIPAATLPKQPSTTTGCVCCNGSLFETRSPTQRMTVSVSPVLVVRAPCSVLRRGPTSDGRPRSGRVQAVRRQVATGHNRTGREQTSRSAQVSRPTTAGSLTRSGEVRLLAVCDLSQKQRNQFASHRPDEHHHSQHQPPSDGPRRARHAGQSYNAGPRSSGERTSVHVRCNPSYPQEKVGDIIVPRQRKRQADTLANEPC